MLQVAGDKVSELRNRAAHLGELRLFQHETLLLVGNGGGAGGVGADEIPHDDSIGAVADAGEAVAGDEISFPRLNPADVRAVGEAANAESFVGPRGSAGGIGADVVAGHAHAAGADADAVLAVGGD